jgi:hypothetical protein
MPDVTAIATDQARNAKYDRLTRLVYFTAHGGCVLLRPA